MADDPALAMGAAQRQLMNGALEAVECVMLARQHNLKHFSYSLPQVSHRAILLVLLGVF